MKKVVKKKKVSKKIWTEKKIKWFTEEVDRWVKKYFLDDWVIILKFEDRDKIPDEQWWIVAADTQPNSVYHKATIYFYPAILENEKEKWSWPQVVNNIKHELVHLITGRLSDLAIDRYSTKQQIEDEVELLTQKISVIT